MKLPGEILISVPCAILIHVDQAIAQAQDHSTIGYVVDDQESTTSSVTCYHPSDKVFKYTSPEDVVYCKGTDFPNYYYGLTCTGDKLEYVTGTWNTPIDTVTSTCSESCSSFAVIEQYPASGWTWTNYDCVELLTRTFGASIPRTIFYESPVDPFTTTTEVVSSTETGPPTSTLPEETMATTAISPTTSSAPSENDQRSEPDIPVIVGAAVGSVVGVALLIVAIFIGIRLERKRAASGETRGFFKSFPRLAVVWPRASSTQDPTVQSSTATNDVKSEAHHHGDLTQAALNQSGWAGNNGISHRRDVNPGYQRHELDGSQDIARELDS